jgi:hypothetical protein
MVGFGPGSINSRNAAKEMPTTVEDQDWPESILKKAAGELDFSRKR